jgi:hypothetical protein
MSDVDSDLENKHNHILANDIYTLCHASLKSDQICMSRSEHNSHSLHMGTGLNNSKKICYKV